MKLLTYCIFILSVISYERDIHNFYYMHIQATIAVLSIICMILASKNKNKNDNYHRKKQKTKKSNLLIILALLIPIVSLLSILLNPDSSLLSFLISAIYSLNIIYFGFTLPDILKNNKDFKNRLFKTISYILFPIIIFGIVLYFKNGLFGYWLEGGRTSSIYFDPNYFSISTLIGAILYQKTTAKKGNKILYAIISIIAILLSGSRGTMLGLFIAVIYAMIVYIKSANFFKKTIIIASAAIVLLLSYSALLNMGFMRIDQGSHGRAELIAYSLTRLKESPIIGFGYDGVSTLMREGNFKVTTSHNSIIDIGLRYGLIVASLEVIIIGISLFEGIKNGNKTWDSLLLMSLTINMNTIIFSIGGLGLPSIISTMIIGETARSKK